jgi:hypothetical protein
MAAILGVGRGGLRGCDRKVSSNSVKMRASRAAMTWRSNLQQWSEISHMAQELCVIPLPLTLLPDARTAELFQRPSRQFGSTIGVEFRRAPLSQIERVLKRLQGDRRTLGALRLSSYPCGSTGCTARWACKYGPRRRSAGLRQSGVIGNWPRGVTLDS